MAAQKVLTPGQVGEVVEVLRPTGGRLRIAQVRQRDDRERNGFRAFVDLGIHATQPGVAEIDASDAAQEVDAIRRPTELKYHAGLSELGRISDARNRTVPELDQGAMHTLGVG